MKYNPTRARSTVFGCPLLDGKQDIGLAVLPKDLKSARGHQADFNHCVLAQAAKRVFGMDKVCFKRDTAIIVMPVRSIRGKIFKAALRYRLTSATKRLIKNFDMSKKTPSLMERVIPGVYPLKAPTPSQTLEVKRERPRSVKRNTRKVRSPKNVLVLKGAVRDGRRLKKGAY